jgi:predicted ABC-type ATPase
MEIPDKRPLVIAIAGPNGAGKSTFYETQLAAFGLRFVNADNLARQLDLDPYKAAAAADRVRRELAEMRESFVFETVFSDPVGDKVNFLKPLEAEGFQVVLCYIGISSAEASEQRVNMRVSKGGHDVPSGKIKERYARTLGNLSLAIEQLGDVRVFDNDDLDYPYRLVAKCAYGSLIEVGEPVPQWLRGLLPTGRDIRT